MDNNSQININDKVEIIEDDSPSWIGRQGTISRIYNDGYGERVDLKMSKDSKLPSPMTASGISYEFKPKNLKKIDRFRAEDEAVEAGPNPELTLPTEESLPDSSEVEEPTFYTDQSEDSEAEVTVRIYSKHESVKTVLLVVKTAEVSMTLTTPGENVQIGTKWFYRVQGADNSVVVPLKSLICVEAYVSTD